MFVIIEGHFNKGGYRDGFIDRTTNEGHFKSWSTEAPDKFDLN